MGKQAKKKEKSEAQAQRQKRHNKATRGMNTKKRGVLWATRQRKVKDEEGNEVIQNYGVYVPPGVGYDPFDKQKNDPSAAQEPFDALHLDWREQAMYYMAEENARVDKTDLGDGVFLYRFYRESPGGNKEVLFEVQSSKKFVFEPKKRRPKGAQKVG